MTSWNSGLSCDGELALRSLQEERNLIRGEPIVIRAETFVSNVRMRSRHDSSNTLQTPYETWKGQKVSHDTVEFGEKVHYE